MGFIVLGLYLLGGLVFLLLLLYVLFNRLDERRRENFEKRDN